MKRIRAEKSGKKDQQIGKELCSLGFYRRCVCEGGKCCTRINVNSLILSPVLRDGDMEPCPRSGGQKLWSRVSPLITKVRLL